MDIQLHTHAGRYWNETDAIEVARYIKARDRRVDAEAQRITDNGWTIVVRLRDGHQPCSPQKRLASSRGSKRDAM